ncbi:early endosome antigen 1-like [Dunckerocampus dactyliophorus]|uniref:early endosome antigen 1-like n=1 Tax=Dunckerocampus dactyliophorus TaxID=161453 RepID=UPI002405A22F|nr:early endosome antigen 1-like [Dunckerocampus dactyliophorus]
MTFNDVKTRKSILTERKRFLDDELARLESQSVKLETEKKDLRAQIENIQENNITPMELRRLRNEELTRPYSQTVKMEAEDADPAEEINSQKNTTEENELVDHKRTLLKMWRVNMETENEELRAQVKVLEDNKAMSTQQNMLLGEKLAHLESWSVKMETHLRMQIKYLQEKEDTLIKQNESLSNEVAQLERWGVTIEKQNENLRARVKVLKENENLMNEVTETIMADLAHSESQRGEDQTEMYRLRTKLQSLRCQLQDQDELLRRLGHAGSLMEKAWAENEKLNNKLSELVDEDTFVKKLNETREELGEHTSVKDRHLERIAELEAAVKDRQLQLEKSQSLLSGKDELLEKQKNEIVHQHEVIDNLNALVTPLKQTIHDLQAQLEHKQILTASSSCGSFDETEYEDEPVSKDLLELKTEAENASSQIKELHQNSDPSPTHLSALRESPSSATDNQQLWTQDLKENKVRLAKENSLLNEKLDRLESQSANVDIKNDDLMGQVEDLCKNEDRLTEQKQLFSEKLAHLETLSAKVETNNGDWMVQVDDPTENGYFLCEKTKGTLIADLSYTRSQRDKNNIEIDQKEHQENKARLAEQNKQLNENLSHLESFRVKVETNNGDWKVQVEDPRENEYILSENTEEALTLDLSNSESQWDNDLGIYQKDLQENKARLAKQNRQLNENVPHHESWSTKVETNHGDPEENENVLSEKTETITDWSNFDSHWDKDDTEVYHLRTDTQVFWCHLRDQGDVKTTTDHAESLMEKEWTENEKLSNKLCELYEKQHVLKKYDSILEEQDDRNNVGDQQSKTVTHLKTTLTDYKLRVEEPGCLILKSQDDTLTKRSKVLDDQHGGKDGPNPFASFRQAFFNCKRQLKRMEEILTANNLETQPKGHHVDMGLLKSPDHSTTPEGCSNPL